MQKGYRKKRRQILNSISDKLRFSYIAIIVLLGSIVIYPIIAYLAPINELNRVMDNITFADDAMHECFGLQKTLKELLRDYTKDTSIFDDESKQTEVTKSIDQIFYNIEQIKQNHFKFNHDTLGKAKSTLSAYERMLKTYTEKAERIMVKDKTVPLSDRSENYEMLLVYKDAVETGKNDFISAEIEFSKTLRMSIDRLTLSIEVTAISITVILLIICILIAFFISKSITVPIKKLTSMVKVISDGNLNVKEIEIKSNDEIGRLSKYFNIMVIRLRELMKLVVEEQEQIRKSELDVLQAQINPHFLYNTLDSVVRMIGRGKNEDVITMITSLSKLFRISLSKGKSIIKIEQEIEHVKNYLTIQTFRYHNKFIFEIDVEEKAKDLLTVKLLLQPIVENSIYHGIEYLMEEGFIKINVGIKENQVVFQVFDNGLGIRPEKLKDIFNTKAIDKSESGVALKNVNERLKLNFGEKAGMSIKSIVDEGTTVKIWTPIIRDISEIEK